MTYNMTSDNQNALKKRVLQARDLCLRDGGRISAETIWHDVQNALKGSFRHVLDYRIDTDLAGIFKHYYLAFSCRERIDNLRENGIPVIFSGDMIAGFPSMELVHGCDGAACAATTAINEIVWKGARRHMEEAAHWCSFEACPGEPAMLLMARDGIIPTDIILSQMGEGCCATQMMRKWPIPIKFIDVPFNGRGKSWALAYLTEQIRDAVTWLSAAMDKVVTVENLNKGIQTMNDVYDAYREYVGIITTPETPPVAGAENLFIGNCMYDCCGDPEALAAATRELNMELKKRVDDHYRPRGISRDPIRIYMCSTMITNQEIDLIENLGGVVLGPNSFDSRILFHRSMRSDTPDPCREMANWSLNHSPWSIAGTLEQRTRWLLDVIGQYRPDGIVFSAVWGCPLGPQWSRYLADEIKKRLNIPWIGLEHDFNSMETDRDGRYDLSGSHRTRLQGFMEILAERKNTGRSKGNRR